MIRIFLVIILGFIGGLISLCLSLKHLLSILISLEFMVLGVFILIIVQRLNESFFVGLMFLIFRVCEGALGLTLLVVIARSFGGDYFNVLGLNY